MKVLSAVFLILLAVPVFSCRPSEVIYKEHVVYNFTTEGFLMPDVLQTVGKAPVTRLDAGLDAGRSRCLEEAYYRAKNRAVRVMFHTNLDIPGNEIRRSSTDFNADYPVEFSESEYIRAQADFQEVLAKGYIALQDSRSSSSCIVVFRIMEKDLIEEIKDVHLSFCVNYRGFHTFRSLGRKENFCGERKGKQKTGNNIFAQFQELLKSGK